MTFTITIDGGEPIMGDTSAASYEFVRSRLCNVRHAADIKLTQRLTTKQLLNFMAIMAKSKRLLRGMVGGPEDAFGNYSPWRRFELPQVEAQPACLSVAQVTVSDSGVQVELGAGLTAGMLGAFAFRLANVGEWCLRYGDRVKLISDTSLTLETFNAISVELKPVFNLNDPEPVLESTAPAV